MLGGSGSVSFFLSLGQVEFGTARSQFEGELLTNVEVQRRDNMCPACIASTAVMVAGAASTGGILAVCIGKFREFFRANGLGLLQKTKEK